MAILQPIHNIAEICSKKGIEIVILCPGSRSAALTISFVRHPKIKTFSISDERSAGFIALGIAQITKKPVAIGCTSGTAALNFSPAIAEAIFQEVPLIVLTADRPDEWINQYDGQTIYQREIYGKHVKKSFHLPSDYSHSDAVWFIERAVNEAINLSVSQPNGPVHINIPIREPFYPTDSEKITFDKNVREIKEVAPISTLSKESWFEIFDIWEKTERKMIAIGQSHSINVESLIKLEEEHGVVILGDIISNIHNSNTSFINSQDSFLSAEEDDTLKPDLLITTGMSFISKNLKLFLRKNRPTYHFHIQETSELIDPFMSLTHKYRVSANYFFERLFEDLDYQKFREGDEEDDFTFLQNWKNKNTLKLNKIHSFLANCDFSDFRAFYETLAILTENSILHLGNSMSVRYANLIGVDSSKNIEVFSNRGTSGIEGSLSTAVGHAIASNKIVCCILGDVSFFYDNNALWNNYVPSNLRIVVMNNHGGNIFRMIDGPSKQPELDEYFETKQKYNCELTAKQAGIEYYKIFNNDDWTFLNTFFAVSNTAKLLEIETDSIMNKEVFQKFKSFTKL